MTKSNQPQNASQLPPVSKVTVALHGREYIVACGAGEERKLAELVKLVDGKLQEIAGNSSNASETRLFMLTCLLLADELVETRKLATDHRKADEALMVAAVDHLRERIEGITSMLPRS